VIDESLDPEEHPSMEGRYRFTLAHEGGGHWRLHRHLFSTSAAQALLFDVPASPSVVCRSSQAKERVERQADIYASCLLMPRKLIFAAWHETTPTSRSHVADIRSAILTTSRPTTMRWTAPLGPWPGASLCRRSPCESVCWNSGCYFAKFGPKDSDR
jgi:hypothetical protein